MRVLVVRWITLYAQRNNEEMRTRPEAANGEDQIRRVPRPRGTRNALIHTAPEVYFRPPYGGIQTDHRGIGTVQRREGASETSCLAVRAERPNILLQSLNIIFTDINLSKSVTMFVRGGV